MEEGWGPSRPLIMQANSPDADPVLLVIGTEKKNYTGHELLFKEEYHKIYQTQKTRTKADKTAKQWY